MPCSLPSFETRATARPQDEVAKKDEQAAQARSASWAAWRENTRGKSMITQYMAISSASLIIIFPPNPLAGQPSRQPVPCPEGRPEW
jgi:hypothetical protein